MRHLTTALILLALLPGCDQIQEPGGKGSGPSLPGNSTVTRNVLLEDCTGFQCTNCPAAAITAQQLKTVYGDRLVVVGVHMGHFADPSPGTNYLTNFHTTAGDEYKTTFGIDFYPAGLVSRKQAYPGIYGYAHGNWSSAVASLIDQEAEMNLWLGPITYDATANTVSGTVNAAILKPVTSARNLTLYLTEDHVADWQLDNGVNVPNYDHRHVLRAALNGTWGEELVAGSAQVGDTLTRAFTYPVPGNVLHPENCALVAYAYSTTGTDRYEVKQATELKFFP